MNTIFSKLKDFVGLNDPMEYEYEYAEVDGEDYQNLYQEEHPQPPIVQEEEPRRRRLRDRPTLSTESFSSSPSSSSSSSSSGVGAVNNVIGMPGAVNGMSEVVVMEPRTFEEMPQAIRALRERKSVVLNLTIMDPDQAQRAVDFVAGGTYAIDGHQERIGESIFLFTPNCVQVSTQQNGTEPIMQQPPVRTPRATPTPAWTSEQVRMA
ncbi:cell division protein SepF [Egbenema bharatensis]|uniref:cell division protein SepF n=1 Tax=Egbenema bharatensis TaxID=3463334 RepID=UPI003A8B98A5